MRFRDAGSPQHRPVSTTSAGTAAPTPSPETQTPAPTRADEPAELPRLTHVSSDASLFEEDDGARDEIPPPPTQRTEVILARHFGSGGAPRGRASSDALSEDAEGTGTASGASTANGHISAVEPRLRHDPAPRAADTFGAAGPRSALDAYRAWQPIEAPRTSSTVASPRRTAEGMRLSPEERAAVLASVPTGRRIDVPGGALSFGFETEFKPDHGHDGRLVAHHFDFLDGTHDTEESGNHEVRSRPTESLGEAWGQMEAMEHELGDDVRSIHFTVQSPDRTIRRIGLPEANGWFARIGDAQVARRAEEKTPWFAFRTHSNGRPDPRFMGVHARSTLRAYDLGNGRFRTEIRGAGRNRAFVEETSRTVCAGLMQPGYVQGLPEHHVLSMSNHPSNNLLAQLKRAKGSELSPNELQAVLAASNPNGKGLPPEMILPAVGYENAPYATEAQRAAIRAANERFAQKLLPFMQDASLDEDARNIGLDELMAEWVRESGLRPMLEDSLLLRPGSEPPLHPENVRRSLDTMDRALIPHVSRLSDAELADLLDGLDGFDLHRLASEYPDDSRVYERARALARLRPD